VLVKRLKVIPWPALVGAAIVFVIALYFLLGSAITALVSLLQKGF